MCQYRRKFLAKTFGDIGPPYRRYIYLNIKSESKTHLMNGCMTSTGLHFLIFYLVVKFPVNTACSFILKCRCTKCSDAFFISTYKIKFKKWNGLTFSLFFRRFLLISAQKYYKNFKDDVRYL
jgi:hypothetical protein